MVNNKAYNENYKVQLKPLGIDDISEVFHLGEEIFKNSYERDNLSYLLWSEDEILQLYTRSTGYCFVARIGQEIAGFLLGSSTVDKNHAKKFGRIQWICVKPEHFKEEIDLKLIQHFLKVLKKQEITSLVITGADYNSNPAIKYYSNVGLTKTSTRTLLTKCLAHVKEVCVHSQQQIQ